MKEVVSALCALVKSELEKVACELVDLEVKRSHGSTHIRLYTDRAGGVTIKEIERATRDIRDRLDESGMFSEGYDLEVSSPGSERSLRGTADVGRFAGRPAVLYLKDGKRRVGSIAEAGSNSVTVRVEGSETEEIPREDILDMHLLFSCDERGE